MDFKWFSTDDDAEKAAMFTPWSINHFLSGVVVAFVSKIYPKYSKWIIWGYIIGHTIYEIIDVHKVKIVDKKASGNSNSVINSIGDELSMLLGLWLGLSLPITDYLLWFYVTSVIYAVLIISFLALSKIIG